MAPNFVSTPTVPSSISTIELRHHHRADSRKEMIATKIARPPSAP